MSSLPLAADAPHLAEFLPPLVATVVYLSLYGKRMLTLARAGRPVARWRAVSFLAGVLLLVGVQVGPADSLADEVLVAHMVQHIVIGDFCSLLIVLGLTGPVLQPLLHIRLTRPLRTLANPLVALLLWALDLYVWHTPLLYQLAIRHDLVHALEHACLLWFGTLLWLGLIGPLPKPAWFTGWGELGYVFAVRLIGAVLANVLIWGQSVFYPVYDASDGARGLNPLSDQNLAGGVMMIEQIIITVLLFAWVFLRFAGRDEQRQQLLDLADAHGVELSGARAARAVNAGSADRLRRRLLDAATRAAPDATPDTGDAALDPGAAARGGGR
ncbi:MAG: cytochrome c oxidase assembly protein [Solirubrobacteraceae bacterium]